MAIKTIDYTISLQGISPGAEQCGGTQGDHRVTAVNISIEDDLYEAIDNYRSKVDGKAIYRFDVYDGEGGIWQSQTQRLKKELCFELEERHTRFGGKITIYLVITILSNDNETEVELYSFSCVLRLKNKPDGVYQEGENYESVASLALRAQTAAQDAIEANVEAREFAAEVTQKLANGEFKGDKGEKGEQGPKGDKGEDAVIDQIYDANSENAQSGKAVAEAVSGYVEKVKGNTYTYQVYAVDLYGEQKALEVDDIDIFKSGAVHQDIPRRQSNGNIMTNTPADDLDCANKKYVDDLVGDIETLLGGI